MNVNEMTDQQIVDVIINPEWWEPEASVLHNLWSNLEFMGMYESDPRYKTIIQLGEKQYNG